MKRATNLIIFGFLLLFTSCNHNLNTDTVYNYIDSTIIHIDTTYVEIPKETVTDIVDIYDTLYLETSVADVIAVVDKNTQTLKGTLKNKDAGIQTITVSKERIIHNDRVKEKEKVVYKYKTHKFYKWYMILTIALLIIYLIKTKKYKWLLNFLKTLLLKK